MGAFLLRRLGGAILVLLGLSVLMFVLVRLAPGDTATALLGLRYTEEEAAAVRERYGLDRSWPEQYARWIGGVLRGDLGESIGGTPVVHEIASALPVTIELATLSLLVAVAVGVPAGVFAAMRRGRASDHLVSAGGVLGLSLPGFWLGTLLILVFALWLGWLPGGRSVPLTEDPVGNLRHMVLPVLSLALAVVAVVARTTRASMLETLGQDYVRTAHAKGLPPRAVFGRHALKNALLPILTIVGVQVGYLLAGAVVIEEVFSLNGIGRLLLRAVGDRDYPLLQGIVLLIGATFVGVNLVVDLLYGWLDPRTRSA